MNNIFSMSQILLAILFCLCVGSKNEDILLNTTAIHIKLFGDGAFQWHRANVHLQNFAIYWKNDLRPWSSDDIVYSKLLLDQTKFVPQEFNGVRYNSKEFFTFWLNTTLPKNTVIK